jgi:hypothetical protein
VDERGGAEGCSFEGFCFDCVQWHTFLVPQRKTHSSHHQSIITVLWYWRADGREDMEECPLAFADPSSHTTVSLFWDDLKFHVSGGTGSGAAPLQPNLTLTHYICTQNVFSEVVHEGKTTLRTFCNKKDISNTSLENMSPK